MIKTIPPKVQEWIMAHFDSIRSVDALYDNEGLLDDEILIETILSDIIGYKMLYEIICVEHQLAVKLSKINLQEIRDELIPYILGDVNENKDGD